ncbi:hypothetical protein H310_15039 [Aphanomyces invadans]|uniref:Transposase n=1 Tax=Aphanomyces invadans TaxID=157072 RepID=A0A024T7X0_9STRA|nr:hypothetical protein H310_15039 [Aphanomyces invadans]ETV90130.1 hypothetical protein H310_15039 [Aphanomyces invadans]|eukprot:XP_008881239.1 hypothetical protein H310_15039 [Aphanomyces invadans]
MTRRSSWTRPYLKDNQKEARVKFCQRFQTESGNINDMYHTVHVDEKWFFMTKILRRFLLWKNEDVIPRHLQSKSHITKVMFLCAVATAKRLGRSARLLGDR